MAAITPWTGFHQSAIATTQAHGSRAQLVQPVHDLFVHATHQHHLHHIHGVGIGDAEAISKFRRDFKTLQPLIDFRSTTMDHNRLNANTSEKRDVAKNGSPKFGVGHGSTAVLDHDPTSCEALDVGQSLTQHRDAKGIICNMA